MDRKDFIRAIFSFFNVKDESDTLYRAYDLALSTNKNVDWDKLYITSIKEVQSNYLPKPKFFIELFDKCRKISINSCENDGSHIRVIFKSGRYTDFVLKGFGLSLDDIKAKSPKNDNVQEVRMYPKEVEVEGKKVTVALIGDTVYPEQTRYEVVYARN